MTKPKKLSIQELPDDAPSTPPPVSQQPETGGGVEPVLEGFDLGEYVRQAWEATTGEFVTIVVGFLVIATLFTVACFTIAGGLFLFGPFCFGYLILVQKSLRGEPVALGDIFDSFRDLQKPFVTGFLFMLVICVLAVAVYLFQLLFVVGLLASALLLLIAGSLLYFVMPIAALSDASPSAAFKKSFEFCLSHMWPVLLLTLFTGVLTAVGFVCAIGWVFTIPLGIVTNVVAYNEYYLRKAV